VITQIYAWRADEQLAYKTIAERLNANPDRYPPPQPNRPDRARHCWTTSSVREVLINPKYIGYMVWNRRATKKGGAVNPTTVWVWSPEPTHEPHVTKDTYDGVQQLAAARRGSRHAGMNTHPATRRTYVLRHYVHCGLCDKRMFGKTRKNIAYYTCQPQLDRVGHPETYANHPRALYAREDRLLDCVQAFFAERVFGPDRASHLAPSSPGATSAKTTSSPAASPPCRRPSPIWHADRTTCCRNASRDPPIGTTRPRAPGPTGCAPASPTSKPSAPQSTPNSSSYSARPNATGRKTQPCSTPCPCWRCVSWTRPMRCSASCSTRAGSRSTTTTRTSTSPSTPRCAPTPSLSPPRP
jgi:hypothetical protein